MKRKKDEKAIFYYQVDKHSKIEREINKITGYSSTMGILQQHQHHHHHHHHHPQVNFPEIPTIFQLQLQPYIQCLLQ